MYSVYGSGPPPLPTLVAEEEEVVEEDNPYYVDPAEEREHMRMLEAEWANKRHANDFAMQAIAFGIAGTILYRGSN